MKNKKFFIHIVSNFVIILVVGSILLVSISIDPTEFTSSEGYSAIYRGDPENNNISLMINVYWGTEFVEPMLDILEEKNATATFFVGGTWANSNSDILNQIYDNGHELGNHGYYHKDHTRITRERNREEINITHELVKALTTVEMDLFAPPSGAFSATTLEVAEDLGYKTIMWSKDTIDWRDNDSNLVYNRATNNPQNGDLILMHPTEHTLNAFEDIITFYQDNSFNVTTVSNTI
jgi:peptidoglycan/xylan/chitin deacetylase (PgdA/CDA1 family)